MSAHCPTLRLPRELCHKLSVRWRTVLGPPRIVNCIMYAALHRLPIDSWWDNLIFWLSDGSRGSVLFG